VARFPRGIFQVSYKFASHFRGFITGFMCLLPRNAGRFGRIRKILLYQKE